jgi:hypothetical protein
MKLTDLVADIKNAEEAGTRGWNKAFTKILKEFQKAVNVERIEMKWL